MNNDIYSSNGRLTSSPSTTAALEKLLRMPVTTPVNIEELADFSNVCRICAIMVDHVIPIFEGEGLQNKLEEKICKYLPIVVCRGDGLPRGVCAPCSRAVLGWHELAARALAADSALNARLLVAQGRAGLAANINKFISGETENDTKAARSDSEPRPERDASDHSGDDDTPLAALAAHRTSRAYENFHRALIRFRDHYGARHNPSCKYPEFTDSSDTEAEASADAAGYDDLSPRYRRRARQDSATRSCLRAAATRAAGRTLYACPTCGKRLSSPHTFVLHRRIHSGERPCVCHVCGRQFRAPHALRRHLTETHERARRPACRTCLRTFANAHNLRQHLRTHTGERPYVCARCGKRFTQSGSLHAHLRTHSDERPHACPLCPAAFRLRGALARHRLRHSGERPHACTRCPRAFRSRAELAAHSAAHSDARPHACALCPAAFRQPRALRLHARRVHHLAPAPPPPPLWPAPPTKHIRLDKITYETPTRRRGCPYCDERVPPEELRRHLVERHVDLMFHCDECDSYVDRSEFIVHMSLHVFHIPVTPAQPAGPAPARPAEADTKPTQMLLKIKPDKELEPKREKRNTVKKSIDSEENEFSDHSDRDRFDPLPEAVLRAIEDPPSVSPGPAPTPLAPTPLSPAAPPRPEPPGRTRACLQCGKVYTAASSYFYHVKHAHSSRREHACATCDARFATRAGLAQHAAVHSAERRHACATCGARFRSRGALYIHAQTHGAAKRCVCATCGRAFRWQAALARHAARHRAERAHACGSCGRGFAVRADLLRHARTHAPRAAPCPHCARRFAQPRYLRAHLARTHPHQPHQPPPALLC